VVSRNEVLHEYHHEAFRPCRGLLGVCDSTGKSRQLFSKGHYPSVDLPACCSTTHVELGNDRFHPDRTLLLSKKDQYVPLGKRKRIAGYVRHT
jgi:hypothetical protein